MYELIFDFYIVVVRKSNNHYTKGICMNGNRHQSDPLSLSTILLLEFTSNSLLLIDQLLTDENYIVQRYTPEKYQRFFRIKPPQLIIFDFSDRNYEQINESKAILHDYFHHERLPLPPFLAYIKSDSKNKQEIYEFGMLDYISLPPIKQEISYRVEQAINHFCHQTSGKINRFSKSDYKQNISLPTMQKHSAHIASSTAKMQVDPTQALAEKTANYLIENISEEISLTMLSSKMATNRNKLASVFKAYFGCTIFTWQREQRMLQAAELLKNTTQSILTISEQVGYQDSNNFSTAFRRKFSLSPKQYQKNNIHRQAGSQFNMNDRLKKLSKI